MQNFRSLGAPPPDPLPPAAGGSAPRPPKQLPHCEFPATRLFCVDADDYVGESLKIRFLKQERQKKRFMLLIWIELVKSMT